MTGKSDTTNETSDITSCVFDLLADSRRRILLTRLDSHAKVPAVADIARDIAEYEHGAPVEESRDEVVQRIHVSLYHRHVPRLEDAGIVTYDQDRNTVALTERGERYAALAQRLTDEVARSVPEQGP